MGIVTGASQDQLRLSTHKRRALFEKEMRSLHGERYTQYRRDYKQAGLFEFEPEFPVYVMFEQTYRCNFTCPSCIQGYTSARENFKDDTKRMGIDTFKKVIDECSREKCPSISMHSNDEPLLVKDLEKRIRYAKDSGIMEIIMTTNGSLLTKERFHALVDAGLTNLLFSTDAATPEVYAQTRPGGDFERVVEMMNYIKEYKKENKTSIPYTRASFVQSLLNAHETQAFADKFAHLVDEVEIQGFSSYYHYTDLIKPGDTDTIKDFSCNQPWRTVVIRPNGDVLPCCSFYGYELTVGNINENSLKDIYNSEEMKQMRIEHSQGEYTESACKACARSFS